MPESETLPAKSISRSPIRRQKDQRLRRIVRQCRKLAPHLDDPIFAPVLQGFARVSIMLNDSYERLRGAELSGEDGELRPSIDTIRKLAESQSKLAERLGITPASMRAFKRERPVDLAAAFAESDD